MQLPKLNFGHQFDFKMKRDKDNIFIYDIVRKNWFILTPEEWVRQHWIHYFVFVKKMTISSLIIEKKIELNQTTKRIDLLITKKTKPFILLELKAPHVPLTEKVFEQIARYNTIIYSPEIIISNGIQHIKATLENNEYTFSNLDIVS